MARDHALTIAVIDPANHVLGVVTIDDVLEATIPGDWQRRGPPARARPSAPGSTHADGPTTL
jgi:CBS domain containing-hemolysin-like protein